MKYLFTILALASVSALARTETPAERAARPAWWREARFGMFIHYGPVTLTGQEISWSRANSNTNCPNKGNTPVEVYDNLFRRFNPMNFNAADWTDVANAAGMKYVVLTAKHCDGFLLWDSKVDEYNIMATPFKRDLCAEFSQAARKGGLRLGWYFSPMDWRDPDCRSANNARFIKRIHSELRELLSNYGTIDLLWFDTDARPAVWGAEAIYPMVRQLQPAILLNNRLEIGSVEDLKQQRRLRPNQDFYTPEQRIGSYDDQVPWETCMTLGTQWAWKPNDQIKSAAEVIGILARTVGSDGNLLLNVGPMPDGRIEPRQVEVLKHVGAWLARNGDSIYGTRGGPWKPTSTIASTRKGDIIYVHVLKWPAAAVKLPGIPAKVVSATLLNGGKVEVRQTKAGIEITVPPAVRDANDTVVALKLDADAMTIPALETAEAAPAAK